MILITKAPLHAALVVGAAAVVALSMIPAIASAKITQQLDAGDTGPQVRELQQFLAQFPNIYPRGTVTGFYDNETVGAVQRYQCSRNIVCGGTSFTTGYGRVGPQTMARINQEMAGGGTGGPATIDRNLGFGSRGQDVTNLQSFLSDFPNIYPSGLVTGFFGQLTQAAVQRYQCSRNIVCSGTPATTGFGFVGPNTRATINAEVLGTTTPPTNGTGGPATIGRTLNPGTTGVDVENLQLFLADFPTLYPEGLVTGFYGDLTTRAVQRYQCARNIVCSGTPFTTGYGRVGPTTLARINAEIIGGGTGGSDDTVAPTMSAPIIVSTSTTAVAMGWTTNEDAISRVLYGRTITLGQRVEDNTFGTVHVHHIRGLQANTQYFFVRESEDRAGNVSRSQIQTFRTGTTTATTTQQQLQQLEQQQ